MSAERVEGNKENKDNFVKLHPLIVVSGCMFGGKTLELMRMISRAEIAGLNVQVFKPRLDDRYGATGFIRSHAGTKYPATPVNRAEEILTLIKPDTNYVVIDEVQFFSPEEEMNILTVVRSLRARAEVVCAGLPIDFRGEPFGLMPQLMAQAQKNICLTAICTHKDDNGDICGRDATMTQRYVDGKPSSYYDPVVLVGGKKQGYEPRCLDHWEILDMPD